MAIEFDIERVVNYVQRYDQSTGITTTLNVNAFDLFDSGAEVGDAMCFGAGTYNSGDPWHNLYLQISTPLSIVAAFKWYYRAGDWYELTITNDGTNGFTQSGWIEFDTPLKMIMATGEPCHLTYGIKCEIDSFTSISTVGQVDARPLTNTWRIDVSSDETMTSIKAANDSGGWGVVEQDGIRFKVTANLNIQSDGSITSLDEIVELGDDNTDRLFRNLGTLQLGDIEASGLTKQGSIWHYSSGQGAYPYVTSNGVFKLYCSEFNHRTGSDRDLYFTSGTLEFIDSTYRDNKYHNILGALNFKNTKFEVPGGGGGRLDFASDSAVFDNVIFVMASVWGRGSVEDMVFQNCDFSADYLSSITSYGTPVVAIDCDFGGDPDFKAGIYLYGKVTIKFNLNLIIHDRDGNDITNPILTIEDGNGNDIYSGVYSGGDVLLVVYVKEKASGEAQVITEYNPFTIKIEKSGYQYYQDIMDVESRLEHSISLQPSVEYIQESINAEIVEETFIGDIE
jgi:hypothetical protein